MKTDIWDLIGHVATGVVVAQVLIGGWLWLSGLLPALWRLGNGLSRRKIAVLAKGDAATMLTNLLLDSKLFVHRNVQVAGSTSEVGRAEGASVLLVHWPDWEGEIDRIIHLARDGTPLVVYAPGGPGSISAEAFRTLSDHRNTVVSNFRGRLMNDIVTSMITTSYE